MGLIQILNKDRLQKPGLESVKLEDYLALCNVSEPSIKRFYIIMNSLWSDSLLKKKELKDRCIKIAKRLEEVEGWPYPEFSDKTKFDAFLDKMIRERLIKVDKEGKLKPSKITERVKRDYSIFFDKDFISKIMDYD
jgi:glycerol-3-phosphate O-acyltransferase